MLDKCYSLLLIKLACVYRINNKINMGCSYADLDYWHLRIDFWINKNMFVKNKFCTMQKKFQVKNEH